MPQPDVGAYAVDTDGYAWLRHAGTGWTQYRSTPNGFVPTGKTAGWEQIRDMIRF